MLDSSPEDEDFPGRLLHQAALWDNTHLLIDLLEGGQQAFINSQDSWGRTPLHAAAICENSNCLQILLNAGADPNIQCGPRGDNKIPLHLSAEHGHSSNVSILLQHGSDILMRDANGHIPIDLAEKSGHMKCVDLLKEAADAKEKARLDIHAALRDACSQGDINSVTTLIVSLAKDAELIINMAPSGVNTLLFIACQMGNKEIVKILLQHGADGRYHPVTKYSPLYIACHNGHRDIVEMLLLRFPELVQQHTVERWLPIHACTINGHVSILELLFNFPYPSSILKKYHDGTEQWEYLMPFDINERDATGQNILYIACLVGNKRLLDVILKFRVKATRLQRTVNNNNNDDDDGGTTPISENESIVSPTTSTTRRRISDGIQSIMSKLNLTKENSIELQNDQNQSMICPLRIDVYCNNNTETALHAAIRNKHYDIVLALLNAGANPNCIIKAYHDIENLSCCSVEEDSNYGQSTGLVEACRNRDVQIVDLLLKYGARDDECKALSVVVQNKDEILIAKLLSTKAHPDPEFKINKKAMTENVNSQQFTIFSNVTNLTYSTLFPNTPTMINWHNQKCNLQQIRTQWLIDASLNLNPKLKQNPKNYDIALYAITRLDLSNNNLITIPLTIFELQSLKYLNLGQNKIEKLPIPNDEQSLHNKIRTNRNKKTNYTCPVLEELYLQDNRLDHIPEAIFRLPSLITLVVSNNKLQQLPYNMWLAPKLKELNCSFNLLKELPTSERKEGFDRFSISSNSSDQLSTHIEQQQREQRDNYNQNCVDYVVETIEDSSDVVRYRKKERSLIQFDLIKHHIWNKNVEVTEQILHNDDTIIEKSSKLSSLNLAHNLFTSIPVVLPCLAVNLTRLNLSFNSLRSMSHITSYPLTLKQLDLSHNQITCWPSLPQIDTQDLMEMANVACYASTITTNQPSTTATTPTIPNVRRQSSRSVRNTVLHSVCSHRRHLRLDNLRTLILADNQFNRIQLATDDDGGCDIIGDDEDFDRNHPTTATTTTPTILKSRLMFPNLSMLDISNNNLKEIPTNIYELNNLSVLNISGNLDINELPPQMGLLSRLWNLNTRGCSLQDPLKSMIDSKKYKTMDIIGYLKSVLEDAKPYARMKLMIVGVQGIGKTSLLEQLRQEGITRRRPEHWAKRMGNKNINIKTSRGTNMSTVGVDIGDWIYEKKVRNHSIHGPVIFRTWDFGGQKEYYATHQYFLSKRSLYLVVWRIIDGHRGINDILQWLVNIQARAPNSPVIIVGTHYDVVQEFNPNISEDYQQIIRERFINIVDAEKCGLPRVLDTIEISCKTRHNIKLLCNLIYDTVFNLRPPGSKELLLEQKVPATYLALEDVINHIAIERRLNHLDPVLNTEQYRTIVTTEMQQRYNKLFRDWSELHQATLFLHDNGVLLHYDDATLKDLYFLDPQWLCDILAHVVTIREINPFARNGIMKLDDLKHIFKTTTIDTSSRGYIVNLLNKFEVALTWDSRTLLIPSLLPSEEDLIMAQLYPGQYHQQLVKVNVPLRSRGWAVRNKKITVSPKSLLYRSDNKFQMNLPSTSNNEQQPQQQQQEQHENIVKYQLTTSSTGQSITRLLLMSYFPSGFWSRLISRILADDSIVDIIRSFFILPKDIVQDLDLVKLLDLKAEWILWQTGLQLKYGDIVLFRMKEILHNSASYYRQLRFRLKQDGIWCDVDLQTTSILEIHFPVDSLVIKPIINNDNLNITNDIIIKSTPESQAQLLALAVDHVDILLEDWYPTLGTRFVHTSEGKFLVTRLVPCPECLQQYQHNNEIETNQTNDLPSEQSHLLLEHSSGRIRKSQESYTSCDSGVGYESTESSRMPSMEGHPNLVQPSNEETTPIFYSWMVEECILAAYTTTKSITCPIHADIQLARITPDIVFIDLGERYLIRPENIKKGHLLGRGAFGFVFKGTCKIRGSNQMIDVAMKMLQPVQPDRNAHQSALIAYKAVQSKWDRDPLQYACKAYCTARQELNILLTLRHPNIVPFIGICTSPLALVLDLAPQGALDLILRHYRRSGTKIGLYTLQTIILQVAKAIEYLHRQHIIYRDLKSENVLVWEIPPPFSIDHPNHAVHIKLADYGISRLTLPTGMKGFGGTEGFMAPEIMRYNGEEEYTEKVDCFSFGMFIYELLTLHQPFEGYESVKECILEGGRPPLTYRETLYPSYFLDLMVLCWSQQPKDRPSASQIVSIASAPEFTHLCDVVSLKHDGIVCASTSTPIINITDDGLNGTELWLMCTNSRVDLLLATNCGWLQYHTMLLPIRATCTCAVGQAIWVGDCCGNLHAYSASDGYKLFSYALETEPNTQIESLLYLKQLKRVACALSNGRLFLLNSEILPATPTAAEGTFVMTELGTETKINCMCAVFNDNNGKICELWCGESNSQIAIYTIKDQIVAGQEAVNHYQPLIEQVNVMNLIGNDYYVWSYVYPGCLIYQWDQKKRVIINKLDCSKLVPCSESLKSIAIEEHLSPTNCQVTSLAILNDELYIGTTWGCIIIAESSTLRPITIFRPFEDQVKAIVPLAICKTTNNSNHNNVNNNTTPMIATIGRGYRNLLTRYTDISPHSNSSGAIVANLTSPILANPPFSTAPMMPSTTPSNKQNMFVLLWRAEHWNAV